MTWARLLIGLVMLALAGSACARTRTGDSHDPLSSTERAELLQIGEAAVQAILAGDLERLWLHARSDLRESPTNRRAMGTELEAYLFGDVRRVIAAARQPTIRVVPLGTDGGGVRWAQLVFFDRSKVTEGMLRDRNFLCEHDLRDAVAWTFLRARGRWESIGYPFDAFTDIHCPPPPSQIGIRRLSPGREPASETGLLAAREAGRLTERAPARRRPRAGAEPVLASHRVPG